mmetsp:Transcript_60973/g.145295  ORF Transcript_60973/g.145295 Transcript_60973/m.145295 type:complete len:612 (+) Transcript_60973:143-1978(+)
MGGLPSSHRGCCCSKDPRSSQDAEHVNVTAVQPEVATGAASEDIPHYCSSRGDQPKADLITTKAYFPTHCLPMADFLTLEVMQTHESLSEKLILPDEEIIVHFISHEWLGFQHPDPDGTQLKLMQRIFQNFIGGQAQKYFDKHQWDALLQGVSQGTGKVYRHVEESLFAQRALIQAGDLPSHVASGCVWLDYHSIPQDTQKSCFAEAVKSIPYYVERCDYFWICAPPAIHHDLQESRNFYTWRGRGWCRLEEATNLLCRTLKMPLVVTTDTQVTTYGFLDAWQYIVTREERSVANGKFTCCRFGHKVALPDGSEKTIPCDREAIAPVLANMFESLFAQVQSSGDRFKKALLLSFAPAIYAGFQDLTPPIAKLALPWQSSPTETLEEFVGRFGYKHVDEEDEHGWPCLVWVILCGSSEMLRKLLQHHPGMLKKHPPGHMASVGYAVHRTPEDFKYILSLCESPAEALKLVNHRSASGYTAVDRAAKFGNHENLEMLLDLSVDIEPRRVDSGATPLLSASEEGFPLCVQALLAHRADVTAVDHQGRSALHLAAPGLAIMGNEQPGARLQVLRMLLGARADPKCVDANGKTPIQIASDTRFHEAVDLLSVSKSS